MGKIIINNNNLSSIQSISIPNPEAIDDITIGVWEVYIYKIENICNLIINISFNDNKSLQSKKEYNFFTIPEGYRPITSIYRNYTSQYGSVMLIKIDSVTGMVNLWQMNDPDSTLITWNFPLRQDFCYITNQ